MYLYAADGQWRMKSIFKIFEKYTKKCWYMPAKI